MKKFISAILAFMLFCTITVPTKAAEPEIAGESAILLEASTGEIIYEKNPDIRLRPASITKIMTLLLIFDALTQNGISLSDQVTVSEHAASMGGSQVFLEAGEVQTVETLIKCISIASANDACVAMAEYICGTEAAFVERMNDRAFSLGMTNTHFVNCCGLDADEHLTTARDVSIMTRELITRYPQIHNYSMIWMDTITHITRRGESEFILTNTNKLIKQYEWATGLKTGSTSLAKFCLSATARKDGIELISVVMGSPSGKTRVSDSITLLNYGYSATHIYTDNNMPTIPSIPIVGGTEGKLDCTYSERFSHLFLEAYDDTLIECSFDLPNKLTAPIKENEVVGKLVYRYNGKEIGHIEIKASQNISKAVYRDYLSMLWKALYGIL